MAQHPDPEWRVVTDFGNAEHVMGAIHWRPWLSPEQGQPHIVLVDHLPIYSHRGAGYIHYRDKLLHMAQEENRGALLVVKLPEYAPLGKEFVLVRMNLSNHMDAWSGQEYALWKNMRVLDSVLAVVVWNEGHPLALMTCNQIPGWASHTASAGRFDVANFFASRSVDHQMVQDVCLGAVHELFAVYGPTGGRKTGLAD